MKVIPGDTESRSSGFTSQMLSISQFENTTVVWMHIHWKKAQMLPISQITLRNWCFLRFSRKEMFSTTCEWCVQHDMQQTSKYFWLRSITKDFSDKICTRKMYLHYFDQVKTAWHLACMQLFVFIFKFFPPCLYVHCTGRYFWWT